LHNMVNIFYIVKLVQCISQFFHMVTFEKFTHQVNGNAAIQFNTTKKEKCKSLRLLAVASVRTGIPNFSEQCVFIHGL